MASVPCALYPRQDRLAGDPLAVLGQAQEAHEVDETGGEVKLAAELAGGVVVGERVVVVVESLTWTGRGSRGGQNIPENTLGVAFKTQMDTEYRDLLGTTAPNM